MCCGSKRLALRNTATSLRAPSATPSASPGASGRVAIDGARRQSTDGAIGLISASARGSAETVTLEHIGASGIRLWGPVTGRKYDFSAAQPAQGVDLRDAAVLTRSGLFRRV